MSAADTRRDTGDFYPGGKRVVTTPVTMGGDVKHSDFADVTVETNTIPKMRQAIETLAQKLGATVAAVIAAAFVANGAGFDSVPVNEIDFDENPSVVTNVTFDGLITEHQPLTNYYSKAETDAKIVELAPVPGNYSVVSNKAMTALQSYTETDPTIYSWAKGPSKPSYAYSEITGVPTTWAWSDITGKPTTWAWSNISDKPSWIGSSKPSYSLNDVCPETENWLGVPGTTAGGKSIKVLAKTVNGVIEGGMTVTGSSNNDNNTTKYRYGGVTATRNGTATDYLFDTSSQSGIVRRSELASLAPGDYATVSNKAANAVQTSELSSLETDPTVPSWAKAANKPSYTASEVGAAPSSLTSAVSSLSNNVVTVSNLIAAVAHEWSATNTTAVISYHYGKEIVAIPSGGTLTANLSDWNDGEQSFVVLEPSGAYTVASNVKYCGYGNWPTNTALCVAWPYAGTLYVNPIITITE